jgi:hypothetical protein
MEKTNTEKIANEMSTWISENSSDSESFDVESGMKMPKIGPKDQAMLSSRNQLLSKGRLMQ